jgi:excisionase family DNA binding protein
MTLRELPPTITVERAGELLGISRRSAYRAAASGELPTIRLGRRLLVPSARLLALLGLPEDRLADAPARRSA